MSDDGDYYEEGNCYEVMKLIPPAIAGDARAAAALWRQLAADSSSANHSDLQRWIQHVAKRLVCDVIDGSLPPNRKAEAARRAVGLSGQIGDAELRQYIAEHDKSSVAFPVINADGSSPLIKKPTWKSHLQFARELIAMGMVDPAPRGKGKAYLSNIAKRIARIRDQG